MLISSTLVHSDLHHSAIKPLPFVYPHVLHLPDPQTLFNKSSHADQSSPSPSSDDAALTAEKQAGPSTAPKKGPKYYWRMLLRFAFEGTEHNIVLEACGFRQWIGRVLWTLLQGLVIGILFGLPLWIFAIIIIGPIYRVSQEIIVPQVVSLTSRLTVPVPRRASPLQNHNIGNRWAPQTIKFIFAVSTYIAFTSCSARFQLSLSSPSLTLASSCSGPSPTPSSRCLLLARKPSTT